MRVRRLLLVALGAALDADAPGEPDPDVFVYEHREDRESFFTLIHGRSGLQEEDLVGDLGLR